MPITGYPISCHGYALLSLVIPVQTTGDADLWPQGTPSWKQSIKNCKPSLITLPEEILAIVAGEAEWEDVLRLREVGIIVTEQSSVLTQLRFDVYRKDQERQS